MSLLLTLVAAEVPVCTTAAFAAVGWLVRVVRAENERRDTDLARQSQALAVLVAAQEPLDERLAALEKRRDSLTEATAVLGAELEAHQRWHVQPAYHPAHH